MNINIYEMFVLLGNFQNINKKQTNLIRIYVLTI